MLRWQLREHTARAADGGSAGGAELELREKAGSVRRSVFNARQQGLVVGGMSGVCLAGSVVDVRSAVGFAAAGGAGRCGGWVVSGGATGRSAVALVL